MPGYKALWTSKAIKTAGDIVKYLREEWTDKEADNFLDKVDEVIATIEINPKLFRASVKKANYPVDVLGYKEKSKKIEILAGVKSSCFL